MTPNPSGRLARAARRALLALLWGVGVSAFEISGLPWPSTGAEVLLRFVFDTALVWSAIGLLVVAYGSFAIPRWPAVGVLAGHLALAPFVAWIFHLLMTSGAVIRLHYVGERASYGYLLWTVLVYGSLFIVWWIAAERAEATRRLLADAQLARRRGEAELDQARLLALRGRVDPAMVLDVMADVQRRYRDDPAAGDRLLDLLVAFLRCAMPAVRSGTSTLAGEVALVRAWSALMRERDPQRAAWQVLAPESLPDLSFPPLLLLPILEQLGGGAPRAVLLLRVALVGDAATLEVHAHADAPDPAESLVFRLRVGLQAAHGTRWTLALRDAAAADGARLAVTIPLHDPPAGATAPGDLSTTRPGGAPWTMTPAMTTT